MKHIFLTAGMLVVLALNFCKAQNDGEAKSSGGFCVMSYNVRNCKGMDDVVDYARVAAVINKYQPVVVALQELDSATIAQNETQPTTNEKQHTTNRTPDRNHNKK